MTEMKAALTQLKESAAADARFKAALKHNTVGDTQKLQTALAGLVHVSARATLTTAGWPGRFLRDCLCSQARELLKVALGVPGLKDNIRGALQKKLDMTDARLTELEPMIAQHGLTLPTNAAAAHAANSGSSSVPSSPSSATAGAKNPMERSLAGGAGTAADGAPRRERTESAAWKKHQKTAVDGLKKASTHPIPTTT